MAVGLSAAYDWANRPQECLTVLQNEGGGENNKKLALQSLSNYLNRFALIIGHPLLTNRKFFVFSESLKVLDGTIATLFKNTCFIGCCLASDDISNEEIVEQSEINLPDNVEEWIDHENAKHVIAYLNHAILKLENRELDQTSSKKIVEFYKQVQTLVEPIRYVFNNKVITQNTPLDPNYVENGEKFNAFFKAVMPVNKVVQIDGLKDKLKNLYKALKQTPQAISNHTSPKTSATSSPIKPAADRNNLEKIALQRRLALLAVESAAKSTASPSNASQQGDTSSSPLPPVKTSKSDGSSKIIAGILLIAAVATLAIIFAKRQNQKVK